MLRGSKITGSMTKGHYGVHKGALSKGHGTGFEMSNKKPTGRPFHHNDAPTKDTFKPKWLGKSK